MEKIFVYGSLRQEFWNHDKVLKNRLRSIVPGTICAELYHLPAGYPAITSGNDTVYGEVCTLSQAKHLKSIDLLEGYTGDPSIDLYTREKKTVTYADGTQEDCWVYIYMDENYVKQKGQYVAHGDWRKFMHSKPHTKKASNNRASELKH